MPSKNFNFYSPVCDVLLRTSASSVWAQYISPTGICIEVRGEGIKHGSLGAAGLVPDI